jgi:hypothetical protein
MDTEGDVVNLGPTDPQDSTVDNGDGRDDERRRIMVLQAVGRIALEEMMKAQMLKVPSTPAQTSDVVAGPKVCEVCSIPRFVAVAEKMGLGSGRSLDLRTYDSKGEPWGFDLDEKRAQAIKLITEA